MPTEQSSGRWNAPNGAEIYFEVRGSGEPLLLLHGFSGSGQDWKALPTEWTEQFQLIAPDLRGHGRSGILQEPFRHRDAASDMLGLLDHLGIKSLKGIGISGGGNVLLHMATKQPQRLDSMVLVSATPYFPEQARAIMRGYAVSLGQEQWDFLRHAHPGGDAQIQAILDSTAAFADTFDDMNFTPPYLSTIEARTLIVQGDRDPLYPVELSVEMARAIPRSSLWIVPGRGHGPVLGDKWPEFLSAAAAFLRETARD
jgi:pimeloyl-ACP methyl ester carboxylesterase